MSVYNNSLISLIEIWPRDVEKLVNGCVGPRNFRYLGAQILPSGSCLSKIARQSPDLRRRYDGNHEGIRYLAENLSLRVPTHRLP
jgi:hypothetical protein